MAQRHAYTNTHWRSKGKFSPPEVKKIRLHDMSVLCLSYFDLVDFVSEYITDFVYFPICLHIYISSYFSLINLLDPSHDATAFAKYLLCVIYHISVFYYHCAYRQSLAVNLITSLHLQSSGNHVCENILRCVVHIIKITTIGLWPIA